MPQQPFAIAVKAFIIAGDKALLLQRRSNDVHSPGKWDIPGGRLEYAENPMTGLAREVQEETGLRIMIKRPLHVQHFTRDDGQVITMIIFLCEKVAGEIRLSEEHQSFKWQPVPAKEEFPDWLLPVIKNLTLCQTKLHSHDSSESLCH